MQANDIDFVIIGAAKCATTWLQRSLQDDPAVAMPDPELHYFSRNYEKGHRWYFDQFPARGAATIAGEKSNSYLDTPEAPLRLHGLIPHAKLMVQLRNPVERAYSDYCMLYRRGDVGGDIEAHLNPARSRNTRSLVGGLYTRQLTAYFDLFPRDQILVLLYEDMLVAPAKHLLRVRSFLGLPARAPAAPLAKKIKDRTEPMVPPRLRRWINPFKPLMRPLRNSAAFVSARRAVVREIEYPPLTPTLRGRLVEFYERDVHDLGNFLDRDLSHWLRRAEATTSTALF